LSFLPVFGKRHQCANAPKVLLRARRERPRHRATEQRGELAPFYLIELHSVPLSARAGLQDIELARISQEVTERFYNLFGGPLQRASSSPMR
jgi:hypothetical protein